MQGLHAVDPNTTACRAGAAEPHGCPCSNFSTRCAIVMLFFVQIMVFKVGEKVDVKDVEGTGERRGREGAAEVVTATKRGAETVRIKWSGGRRGTVDMDIRRVHRSGKSLGKRSRKPAAKLGDDEGEPEASLPGKAAKKKAGKKGGKAGSGKKKEMTEVNETFMAEKSDPSDDDGDDNDDLSGSMGRTAVQSADRSNPLAGTLMSSLGKRSGSEVC